MTVIMTAPARFCLMLQDCDPAIVAAYHLYQDTLDYLERPCFIVTSGEASFPLEQPEQAIVEESYTISYIGEVFKGTEQDYNHVFELQARAISQKALLYLLRHPQMQVSDERGLLGGSQESLKGVWWIKPERRSVITLMERGGTDEAFWGFTIDVTVRSMFMEGEDERTITPGWAYETDPFR